MKSGTQLSRQSVKYRLIQAYFILGTVLLIIFFIFYTDSLKKQVIKDTKIIPNLFSRFILTTGKDNFDALLLQYFTDEVISKIDYPIIITDFRKSPKYWRNVGFTERKINTKLDRESRMFLRRKIKNMESKGHEIPIMINKDNHIIILGYTYYDDSLTIKKLRFLPYIELFLILIFITIGVYGLSFIKKTEKDILWVGLAKETAHQFGTPISSLVGWIDYLKTRIDKIPDQQDLLPMLDHMHSDIDILKKVASRFGKVGSKINLQTHNLEAIISESIAYFNQRLPHFNNKIEIHFISKISKLQIKVDHELIQWAIENLLKNCIDSMQKKGGNIFITAFQSEKNIYVLFKDEGVGIPKNMYHSIFEPGVTTKQRGWGLGLSLTKRIIEQYHQGKVKVLDSTVNEGTTIEMSLPIQLIVSDINLSSITNQTSPI